MLQEVSVFPFKEVEGGARMELPELRVGQYFSYDNHRTELVVAVDGDKVRWRNNRGFRYLSSRDFSQPYLKWQWEDRIGEVEYLSDGDSIWPLDEGHASRFVTRYQVEDRNTGDVKPYSARYWHCRPGKEYEVKVKAGSFNARRLDCTARYGRKSFHHRTWFYAPEVGHFILREDYYLPRGKRRRIELVSWGMMPDRFPEKIKIVLRQVRQLTLEKNESGHETYWSQRDESGKEYSGAITPMRTYKTSKGFWCRDYQMKYYQNGRRDIVTNKGACRNKEGQWIDRK